MAIETIFFDSQRWALLFFIMYLIPLLLLWFAILKLSKKKKHLIPAILSIIYICILYYYTFGQYFFGLAIIGDSRIQLTYLYPTRIKFLQKEEIKNIYIENGYKGTYMLIIKTTSGNKFSGALSSKAEVISKLDYLKRLQL